MVDLIHGHFPMCESEILRRCGQLVLVLERSSQNGHQKRYQLFNYIISTVKHAVVKTDNCTVNLISIVIETDDKSHNCIQLPCRAWSNTFVTKTDTTCYERYHILIDPMLVKILWLSICFHFV